MKFKLLVVTLCVLASGCSSIVYEEPTTGARARVRFASDLNSIAVVYAYSDAGCQKDEAEWLRLKNGSLIRSQPKKLGIPLWSYNENAAKEVYVDASKRFYGMISASEQDAKYIYSCAVPHSYKFEENKDYEVLFNWQRSYCNVKIYHIAQSGDGYFKNEVANFSNEKNNDNAACVDAFKKGRAY